MTEQTTPKEERAYTPPTDEQLENYAAVRFGPYARSLVRNVPAMREGVLADHRRMQEAAWGFQSPTTQEDTDG
jgi:hypothetical protein